MAQPPVPRRGFPGRRGRRVPPGGLAADRTPRARPAAPAAGPLRGAGISQAGGYSQVPGTVVSQSVQHQFAVGNVWNAVIQPGGGSPVVDVSDDGDEGCISQQDVRAGDQVVITAISFSSVTPADVTAGGLNLGFVPVPGWPGGC